MTHFGSNITVHHRLLGAFLTGLYSSAALAQPSPLRDCTLAAAPGSSTPPSVAQPTPDRSAPPPWLTLAPAPDFSQIAKIAKTSRPIETSSSLPPPRTSARIRLPIAGFRPAVAVEARNLDAASTSLVSASNNTGSTNLRSTLSANREPDSSTQANASVRPLTNQFSTDATTALLHPVLRFDHVNLRQHKADLKTGRQREKRPPSNGEAIVFPQLWPSVFRSLACYMGRGSQVLSPTLNRTPPFVGFVWPLENADQSTSDPAWSGVSSLGAWSCLLQTRYVVVPVPYFGAELRHERWLSQPQTVATDSSLADRP
jgi:hypothetical protein